MGFEFRAQAVTNVNPLQFNTIGDQVVGIVVNCEVNYGGIGLSHQLDLWGELTDAQKEQAQVLYNFLRGKAESLILE